MIPFYTSGVRSGTAACPGWGDAVRDGGYACGTVTAGRGRGALPVRRNGRAGRDVDGRAGRDVAVGLP